MKISDPQILNYLKIPNSTSCTRVKWWPWAYGCI